MAKWIYNGIKYYTTPIGKYKYNSDTREVENKLSNVLSNNLLLMHSKSKRLYYLDYFSFSGSNTSLKLHCVDMQTKKEYWFSSQNMEYVLTKDI